MADKQEPQTDPQQTDPEPQEPDQEAFWKRFNEETAKVVDARLAERDRKRTEKGVKQQRNAKRTTLPGLIADVMFGKGSQ